jgi:plastocyanin
MRVLRLFTAAATVAVFIGLPAFTSTATGQEKAKTAAVRIVDFDYDAKSLTVDLGTTVTWTNTGQRPHTVTDRGGTFDIEPIAPKGNGAITFTVPGTYSYFCRINPSKMNGTVVVTGGPSPVNRIQALDPAREGEQLRFDPNQLTVAAGSTVVLANVGGKPHTLTADVTGNDDPAFDTGVVPPGAEGGRFAGSNASITLPEPGTFSFHCEIHPAAMKGTITVTGEAKKPPAAASAAPRQVSVDIKGFAFKPPQISIAPGGKVTWKNFDSAPHDAKFDDVKLQSKLMQKNDSASLTAPTKPGSYSYLCSVHPAQMRAVLVVVGQNTKDPTGVAAVQPAVAVGGGGPGGGVTTTALVTVILGAFLGGFGIAAFLLRKKSPAAS